MEKALIEKLTLESDEERKILRGETLDKRIYSSGDDFIVSDARLHKGIGGISIRTHTRYVPFPEHRHSYIEMMLVLSGSITHKIGENIISLSEGDVLVMNKHILHSIERAGRNDVGVNIIMSDSFIGSVASDLSGTVFSSLIKENGKRDGAPMYLHFSTGGMKQYENLTENLLLELTGAAPRMGIMARTAALLLSCLSSDDAVYRGGNDPRDKDSRRTLDILTYINDNYRAASLSELGERLYLTTPYLSKIIKEQLGKSFKELVMEVRFAKAHELFLNTELPIGEIIRTVGYENESYFHRMFKSYYGVTPLKLRKEKVSQGV